MRLASPAPSACSVRITMRSATTDSSWLRCGDGRHDPGTSGVPLVGEVGLNGRMKLPVMPPVPPMLAKPSKQVPGGAFSYEPKWDGFRSIIFRDGDEVEIGSRNERPMTRYFPEVVAAVLANFPERSVIDGEIVVADTARNTLD